MSLRLFARKKSRRVHYAITIGAGNYYRTADGGGETGDGAGFGALYLVRFRGVDPAAQQFLGGRRATGGWQSLLGTNGILSAFMWTSSSTFVQASGAFPPGKFGRLCIVGVQHTGTILRLFLDRLEILGSAAITGFYPAVPATQWEYIGVNHVGTEPSTKIDHFGRITWRGVPSDAQLLASIDAIRNTGDLPSAIAGATSTHRQSLKETLDPSSVADGQAAPASMVDGITLATIDRMDRQGSPTVRVIDASKDGTKTYGVLGFNTTCYFTAPYPFTGTTLDVTVDLVLFAITANRHILNCADSGPTTGFALYINGSSQLAVYSYAQGGTVATYALTSLDLGQLTSWRFTYDGTVWRLYKDGVQQGADFTGAYAPATGQALVLGIWRNLTSPFDTGAVFRVRVGAYNAATAHDWDFRRDVIENGGISKGIPATIADRAGSIPLTKSSEGLRVVSTGITGFSPANSMQTPNGIRGNPAGFWAEILFIPVTGATDARIMGIVGLSATGGWGIYSWGAPGVFTNFGDGTTLRGNGAFALVAGALTHVAIRYTGTTMEMYVNGALANAVTFAYAAISGATMALGAVGASSQPVLGGSGGDGVIPTPAEIATAASSALAAGKIVGIPGKSLKRWSIVDDVNEAASTTVIPSVIKDRIGVDSITVLNARLEVSQRTERLWSFETTPILLGAGSFSSAPSNNYQSALNQLPGDPAGFVGAALFRVDSQSVASVVRRVFAARSDDAFGWEMGVSNTNTTLFVTAYNGSTGYGAPSYTITAADVGKLLLAVFVWDPITARIRLYVKRAEVGSGTIIAGAFTPKAGVPAFIGDKSGISRPFDTGAVFGVLYARGVPSPAQIQAHHDAVMAQEKMVQIPGMSGTVIDLTQDGGAAALLADRDIGNVPFGRYGAPTTVQQYARAS